MKKTVLIVTAVMLILGTVGVLGLLLPYVRAQSAMPEKGEFIVEQQDDGTLMLSWPEADRADFYLVEILSPSQSQEEEPNILFSGDSENTQGFRLPKLIENQELTLRVTSVVRYEIFGQEKTRFGEPAMEVTALFAVPTVTELSWTADPEADTVDITFQLPEGDCCRVYLADEYENYSQMQLLTENRWQLQFGQTGDLPLPQWGEVYKFRLDAYRKLPGLTIYGAPSASFCVERQDLLDRNLNLEFMDLGNNMFRLSWDETKGEYYEVQQLNPEQQWVPICQVSQQEERSYTSGRLEKFREFTYRVVAVGGQTLEGSPYAAEAEAVTYATKESAIYATVWPLIDLEAYSDPEKTETAATAQAGKAYCVVEEENGLFGIRMGDGVCYIDSNYCLINLPEYLDQLCSFKITNSRRSIYLVHEFEIPDVTDVITAGYDYVYQSDGTYLVPLLYPTAKKLVRAAESAMAQGYRLKIYDAFRPQKATKEIYTLTSKILDEALPEKPFTDVSVSKLNLPETDEETPLTYRMVMTNGTYALNSFLAQGTSRHNLGVALDLTLEDLATGKEIPMQTSIHDLSWYAVTARNNKAAKVLSSIMKEAGFATLSSEWWHFQDDEAKAELALKALWAGISAEGWHRDDNGWYYCNARGVPCRNQTLTIDQQEYTFDENGYLTDENRAYG